VSGFSDRLFRFVATAGIIVTNPLVVALLGIVDSLVFVVLLCLFLLHRISFGSFLCWLLVTTVGLPVLGWLCLLGLVRLSILLSGREEAGHIDKQSENEE